MLAYGMCPEVRCYYLQEGGDVIQMDFPVALKGDGRVIDPTVVKEEIGKLPGVDIVREIRRYAVCFSIGRVFSEEEVCEAICAVISAGTDVSLVASWRPASAAGDALPNQPR